MRHMLWLTLLSLLLVGCDDGIYSATFIFDGEHQFVAGTQLPGDVYVRAGTAEFATDAHVAGSIYIIGGTLQIDGQVGGDVVVLDGQVTLGPQAYIGGELRLGGGTVNQAPAAVIQGGIVQNPIPLPVEDLASTTGGDDWLRLLITAFLLSLLGGVWARKQPQPLQHVGQTAVNHWLVTGATGLLILLVLPVLLVLMAFTIILLPLVLILSGLFLLLWAYGIVALGYQLGNLLARLSNRSISPGWATFAGTLLLMLLFFMPLVGDLVVGLTAVFSMGALLLTRFGLRSYTPPAFLREEDVVDYGRPPL